MHLLIDNNQLPSLVKRYYLGKFILLLNFILFNFIFTKSFSMLCLNKIYLKFYSNQIPQIFQQYSLFRFLIF